MTNSRHLWLGKGVRAGAERNICSLEPLADVVMESELDQAYWIHRWNERGNLPDCIFPNLIEVISCCDRKEENPVLLQGPSLTVTGGRVRMELGRH